MGSNVISGSVEGIIVFVGNDILFGYVVEMLFEKFIWLSFELGIYKIFMLLIKFMLLMVLVVIVINGFIKGDWLEVFFFGLFVVVGLMFEMFLMIVMMNLVKGVSVMVKKGIVIKNLNVI